MSSLRRFGIFSVNKPLIHHILAAPKTTPETNAKNRKAKNLGNQPARKNPNPKQSRRKQPPSPQPKLTRSQRLEQRNNRKKKAVEKLHPTPPTPPPPPTPAPTTSSDRHSDEERVRKMWTNLDFDFAYSGNADNIMNKIKSFRFVNLLFLHFLIFAF